MLIWNMSEMGDKLNNCLFPNNSFRKKNKMFKNLTNNKETTVTGEGAVNGAMHKAAYVDINIL